MHNTSSDTSRPTPAPVAVTDPMERPTDRPLRGSAVTLRPLAPDTDAAVLYPAAHGDPDTEALWTWMPYGPFPDCASMRDWMGTCAGSADPEFRAVADNATDRPVGMVSWLNIETAHRRLELGHIWYTPAVQRTRVNTEAIYLMLMEAFERLGCRRVEWKCDALNARSRAAALRLGFRFEGVFRHHMIIKGRNRDTAWFALVDADWLTVRNHLERWLYSGESGLSLAALNRPLVEGMFDPAAPAG